MERTFVPIVSARARAYTRGHLQPSLAFYSDLYVFRLSICGRSSSFVHEAIYIYNDRMKLEPGGTSPKPYCALRFRAYAYFSISVGRDRTRRIIIFANFSFTRRPSCPPKDLVSQADSFPRVISPSPKESLLRTNVAAPTSPPTPWKMPA